MAMMLATVNPAAAAAIENITKVGVGNVVVYHARAGYLRDRRSSFPALVMRQHAEDGSLDLLVFMEREDFAFEERVQFQSHNQPHHCWAVVQDQPGLPPLLMAPDDIDPDAGHGPGAITYRQPPADFKSLLAPLMKRIEALENKRGRGRPRKGAKVTLA